MQNILLLMLLANEHNVDFSRGLIVKATDNPSISAIVDVFLLNNMYGVISILITGFSLIVAVFFLLK
jgi:hypothetical protein